ncbi:PREDICTED: 7SK snRNA methylphosphate capping enzyme [Calidris pugnax]|uniref:7SK snRNA methylphosphate capping enzyme n=1 Tax=Calidris pugnax TaxID=198806 RepID=UPI00071CB88C|nr:PREDICTED: 7SK snRNA methylphosphate capping enzyme [Calidris pugnax]
MAAEPEAFLVPPPPPSSSSAVTGAREEEEEDAPHAVETPRPRNGFRSAGGGGGGKRRSSCGAKQPPWKRRRRAASECGPVLPSEFLLGGNIFDPLNLNSLLDEEVSRALNARTPQSSPLPARGRDPVEILVPRDITDPLSLNAPGEGLRLASPAKTARRRHRHRGQQRGGGGGTSTTTTAASSSSTVASEEAACPHADPAALVTPPAPPPCATSCPGRHRKRRRTCSKSEGTRPPPEIKPKPPGQKTQPPQQRQRHRVRKFQYGNYCKYYGYRNPDCEDGRLRAMRPEWFAGKEVLDVGCNVGHLTLSIAKRWGPSRVVGLDIDGGLIRSARQNIRHYLSEEIQAQAAAGAGGGSGEGEGGGGGGKGGPRKGFPAALLASRGPIAAPRLPPDGPGAADFPHNVVFVTVKLLLLKPQLLGFGVSYHELYGAGPTFWGLTPWASYRKRKGLTETTYRNYQRIRLRPEQFPSYLTSPEVGFDSYELLGTPQHSAKGGGRYGARCHAQDGGPLADPDLNKMAPPPTSPKWRLPGASC